MRYFSFLFFALIFVGSTYSQSPVVWNNTSSSSLENHVLLTEDSRYFELDLSQLYALTEKAPMEFTSAGRNSQTIINLPLPNGASQSFVLVESPVMHPKLAAKYPNLKSYSGHGVNGESGRVFLSISPYGMIASIQNEAGLSFIDYLEDGSGLHQTYYFNQMDHAAYKSLAPPMACGYDPALSEEHNHDIDFNQVASNRSATSEQTEIKLYEMALACTGEYGQAKGGTTEAVMATFVQAMSLLNSVVQPEESLKFELIENNDILINLDPSTDFFNNANQGGALLQQNQNYLNQLIGNNNFDIGHIFTMACTDVGGVVSGTACNSPNKGRGVTCHYTNIVNIVYNVMAHEVDHQFSAGHTWANCPGIEGQLASGSAYEPGSGSTIMSYLGSCGQENITLGFNQNNTYYHVKTLEQVLQFSTQSTGATCPDVIPVNNLKPEVTHNHGEDFYIPKSTAFELEAVASDADGDDLTYCWEQYDLGPVTSINEAQQEDVTVPLFMSRAPTDKPLRSFPALNLILTNQSNSGERLPTVGREMNFKCTVRDNHPEAGGWNSTQVTFNVAQNSGPFAVLFPSSPGDQLEGGQQVTIEWNVANSDQAPVNCQSVDIYLSTNSGNNFDILLAESVPNTGSYTTFLPEVTTFAGRIKIKGSDNIFFDISNSNITVTQPTDPYYGFNITSGVYQFACLPEELNYSFDFNGYNGFDGAVDLSFVNDIPDGMNLAWETQTITQGESTDLNITFDPDYNNGYTELIMQGIVGLDTFYQSIFVDTENADFSALELVEPANQLTQMPLATTYSWSDLPNAVDYDIQVATNPNFAPEFIIDEVSNTTETTYVSDEPLNKGTVYFWRVRANADRCGKGDWKGPFYYQTFTEICDQFTPIGLPKNISQQLAAGASVSSELAAVSNAVITDLNISNVDISHDKLDDIQISVKSPAGTEVLLHDATCILTSMKLSFDDESLAPIPCPANTFELVKPVGNLSDFDGETLLGTWELIVTVIDEEGIGGKITNWNLESCGAAIPESPYLVNNEIITVRDGEGRWIEPALLSVADNDNSADELVYTIIQEPQHGELRWAYEPVMVGDTFLQLSIDLNHVEYVHSGDGSNDSFSFIVTDGNGGLLQETTVFIELDPNAPTSASQVDETLEDWTIFPNPSNGQVLIDFAGDWNNSLENIRVLDSKGRVIHQERIQTDLITKSLNLAHLSSGVYSIQLIGKDKTSTKRMIIQN